MKTTKIANPATISGALVIKTRAAYEAARAAHPDACPAGNPASAGQFPSNVEVCRLRDASSAAWLRHVEVCRELY